MIEWLARAIVVMRWEWLAGTILVVLAVIGFAAGYWHVSLGILLVWALVSLRMLIES